jgi:3-(3-hydroxy-phenyl)propionate hydroxylase
MGITFCHTPTDIGALPSRHNYFLRLWQNNIERVLAGWVDELEVSVYRGREVTGFAQDGDGVDVSLSDGTSLRAEYLAGCDGGRSVVRKVAGIDFPGYNPTKSWLIAEAQISQEPAWGHREDATGAHAIGKLEDSHAMRVVLTEQQLKIGGQPTLNDVREALIAVYGTDYGIHSPASISRFTDVTRQAAAYRVRRVLLAGDSAHVHPPMGGQGLNIGVQDAVNLGWKLAQVVKRISPERLLDTYRAERHPVAARVLRTTMAHVALQWPDEQTKALGGIIAEFLVSEELANN